MPFSALESPVHDIKVSIQFLHHTPLSLSPFLRIILYMSLASFTTTSSSAKSSLDIAVVNLMSSAQACNMTNYLVIIVITLIEVIL
jgi:hypothetical protein